MLSIRFGYGRPAFFAARMAERFCPDDKPLGLPKFFGRFFSQTCLAIVFFLSHGRLHADAFNTTAILLGVFFRSRHAFFAIRKMTGLSVLHYNFRHQPTPSVVCSSLSCRAPPGPSSGRPARRERETEARRRASSVDCTGSGSGAKTTGAGAAALGFETIPPIMRYRSQELSEVRVRVLERGFRVFQVELNKLGYLVESS